MPLTLITLLKLVYILVDQRLTEMLFLGSCSVQICGEEVLSPYDTSRVFPELKSIKHFKLVSNARLDVELRSLILAASWFQAMEFFFTFFLYCTMFTFLDLVVNEVNQ